MNKKSLIIPVLSGFVIANGAFANNPKTEKDHIVINSVVYIEDDIEYDLGFDTADYLPEDFNPYEIYVDLNGIEFFEPNANFEINSKRNLPKAFDAYAFPTDVEGFNYIDENDAVEIDFDTYTYLPEGFDPFK